MKPPRHTARRARTPSWGQYCVENDTADNPGSSLRLASVGYERHGFYRLKPGITQLEYRLFRAISVDHDVIFVVQEHPINH